MLILLANYSENFMKLHEYILNQKSIFTASAKHVSSILSFARQTNQFALFASAERRTKKVML